MKEKDIRNEMQAMREKELIASVQRYTKITSVLLLLLCVTVFRWLEMVGQQLLWTDTKRENYRILYLTQFNTGDNLSKHIHVLLNVLLKCSIPRLYALSIWLAVFDLPSKSHFIHLSCSFWKFGNWKDA